MVDLLKEKSPGLIILAAGVSKRMGQPKQLLSFQETTLLQNTINAGLYSACGPIVLVLGAHYEEIFPNVTDNPIHIVENKDWEEGMGGSIKIGIKALTALHPDLEGVVIVLCDQPHLDSTHIDKLVEAGKNGRKSIIASEYGGTIGVPVLFLKKYFKDLARLSREKGAKSLLTQNMEDILKIPFPKGDIDIDTPEDYNRL